MTYRLDEIKDYLIDEDGYFPEHLESDLFDLFASEWNDEITLELPSFELNNVKYNAKTFNLKKKAKKVLDDYCEGKTSYHYDIKITDTDTNEQYAVVTSFHNDEMRDVDIEYIGLKKDKKEKQNTCCDNQKLVSVSSKCDDTFSYKVESNWIEASPRVLNLGSGDYIEFTFCQSCNKINFK